MYRVLIADDNPLIRMGVSNMIPWEELGLVLAGTVDNGISAMDKWPEYKPDILITDIRMPGKDGLCLMDYVRKKDDKVQIIVISAYNEFVYAKEALKFGSLNYILKPIDKKELISTLKRAILCLDKCYQVKTVNEEKLNVFAADKSGAAKESVADSCEENARFYLFAGKPEKLMANLMGMLSSCGESEVSVLKENRKKIVEYLNYLGALAPECGEYLITFVQRMENQEVQGTFQNKEHFQKELYSLLNRLCESKYLESKSNRGLAFRLKNVIENNYWMDLNLGVLAQQFNYSQVYISKIFKQECGCTISKYITRVRMEHACEMICHTDLKIIDIASQVGFNDYIHFAKQFKKYFGETPGKIREREEQDGKKVQ